MRGERDEALAEELEKPARNKIAVSDPHTVDAPGRIAQFIETFVLPFWQVHDSPLVVGDMLGPEVARTFSEGVYPGGDQEALYESMFYKSNACARTDVPWPHRDALLLSVAAHDLIALADPKMGNRKRRKQIPSLQQTLAQLPALERYDQLVVRWAVVEQLQRCVRKDTTVRFWAGKRVFRGRDAPKRILVLPRLRRVRTSTQNVSLLDVWPDELDTCLHTFWKASPVSWLCYAHLWAQGEPRPENSLLSVVLMDPGLRAFVAETVRDQNLSWLGWLYAEADAPLKRSLNTLALELQAYGARDDSLSTLLANIPPRTVNLFEQRIARPDLGTDNNHEKPPTPL